MSDRKMREMEKVLEIPRKCSMCTTKPQCTQMNN